MLVVFVCSGKNSSRADDLPEPDPLRKSTAVALNYCRATFHRIQKYPSKRVIVEEQEKILNNLNLNQIADEEVVRLYMAVLQEIDEMRIGEKERDVIRDTHNRVLYRQLATHALHGTAQVASMQYVEALKTGAKSWWDYRTMVFNSELDTWRLEKGRIVSLSEKTSQFLDTFWKLARKRSIPDNWLVRRNDLDELEKAMRETNLQVRLRVLQRMEHFMECYPPYWYYVGRTQQALGQLFAAAETFKKLQEIGIGHFRKDEMLAAGAANRAIIQDYLGQAGSIESARAALSFSNEAWEVNYMAAAVLKRRQQYDEAEDALLRNLDVRLEQRQSLSALMLLFRERNDESKLVTLLSRPDIVQSLPMVTLLQCVTTLSPANRPALALNRIHTSATGDIDLSFGQDDIAFRFAAAWNITHAEIQLQVAGQQFVDPYLQAHRSDHKVRFRQIIEMGTLFQQSQTPPPLVLIVKYPQTPELRLTFYAASPARSQRPSAGFVSFLPGARNLYQFDSVQIGDALVAFHAGPAVPAPPELSAPETQSPEMIADPSIMESSPPESVPNENGTSTDTPPSDVTPQEAAPQEIEPQNVAPLIPPPPAAAQTPATDREDNKAVGESTDSEIELQAFEIDADEKEKNADHKTDQGLLRPLFKARRFSPLPVHFRLMKQYRDKT